MRIADFLLLRPSSRQLATLGAVYADVALDDPASGQDMMVDLYELCRLCSPDDWRSVVAGYCRDQAPERCRLISRIESKLKN